MDTLQKIIDEMVDVISTKVKNQLHNTLFSVTERLDNHATRMSELCNQLNCLENDNTEHKQRLDAMFVFDKLSERLCEVERKLGGEQPDKISVAEEVVRAIDNDYGVRDVLRDFIKREISNSETFVSSEEVREIISECIENDDDLVTMSTLEDAVDNAITDNDDVVKHEDLRDMVRDILTNATLSVDLI